MSQLDLHALNGQTKEERAAALAETNARLETLSAEERVRWALEHLPGEFVLSSSFGIQAAVCLHLVTRERPDIPVILTGKAQPEPENLPRRAKRGLAGGALRQAVGTGRGRD